jgi:hypothetical protein
MSEEEFDEIKYIKLLEELDAIFPNCPFSISCINDIKQLDETFTEKKDIIIKDDRANEFNYYYSNLNKNELAQYTNYLVIKQKNDVPITLRQILTEMSHSTHYNNSIIMKDDHRFLEGFDKMTDIEYISCFGS